MEQQQAPQQPPVYVKFGPKPHQLVSADVAAMMLTAWCDKQPAVFGAYLAEALTGTRPRGGRS